MYSTGLKSFVSHHVLPLQESDNVTTTFYISVKRSQRDERRNYSETCLYSVIMRPINVSCIRRLASLVCIQLRS